MPSAHEFEHDLRMSPEQCARPVALVTGVGRTVGIEAGIATRLGVQVVTGLSAKSCH